MTGVFFSACSRNCGMTVAGILASLRFAMLNATHCDVARPTLAHCSFGSSSPVQ